VTPWQLFLIWVPCAIIAVVVGTSKGRAPLSVAVGVVLGPLGMVIMLCVPPSRETAVRRAQVRLEAEAEARRRIGL
jgi:hypothetical protein